MGLVRTNLLGMDIPYSFLGNIFVAYCLGAKSVIKQWEEIVSLSIFFSGLVLLATEKYVEIATQCYTK